MQTLQKAFLYQHKCVYLKNVLYTESLKKKKKRKKIRKGKTSWRRISKSDRNRKKNFFFPSFLHLFHRMEMWLFLHAAIKAFIWNILSSQYWFLIPSNPSHPFFPLFWIRNNSTTQMIDLWRDSRKTNTSYCHNIISRCYMSFLFHLDLTHWII